MRCTHFGNTGLLVSKMAFGAMTFGLGKALKDKRNDVIISTKCGFRNAPAVTSAALGIG